MDKQLLFAVCFLVGSALLVYAQPGSYSSPLPSDYTVAAQLSALPSPSSAANIKYSLNATAAPASVSSWDFMCVVGEMIGIYGLNNAGSPKIQLVRWNKTLYPSAYLDQELSFPNLSSLYGIECSKNSGGGDIFYVAGLASSSPSVVQIYRFNISSNRRSFSNGTALLSVPDFGNFMIRPFSGQNYVLAGNENKFYILGDGITNGIQLNPICEPKSCCFDASSLFPFFSLTSATFFDHAFVFIGPTGTPLTMIPWNLTSTASPVTLKALLMCNTTATTIRFGRVFSIAIMTSTTAKLTRLTSVDTASVGDVLTSWTSGLSLFENVLITPSNVLYVFPGDYVIRCDPNATTSTYSGGRCIVYSIGKATASTGPTDRYAVSDEFQRILFTRPSPTITLKGRVFPTSSTYMATFAINTTASGGSTFIQPLMSSANITVLTGAIQAKPSIFDRPSNGGTSSSSNAFQIWCSSFPGTFGYFSTTLSGTILNESPKTDEYGTFLYNNGVTYAIGRFSVLTLGSSLGSPTTYPHLAGRSDFWKLSDTAGGINNIVSAVVKKIGCCALKAAVLTSDCRIAVFYSGFLGSGIWQLETNLQPITGFNSSYACVYLARDFDPTNSPATYTVYPVANYNAPINGQPRIAVQKCTFSSTAGVGAISCLAAPSISSGYNVLHAGVSSVQNTNDALVLASSSAVTVLRFTSIISGANLALQWVDSGCPITSIYCSSSEDSSQVSNNQVVVFTTGCTSSATTTTFKLFLIDTEYFSLSSGLPIQIYSSNYPDIANVVDARPISSFSYQWMIASIRGAYSAYIDVDNGVFESTTNLTVGSAFGVAWLGPNTYNVQTNAVGGRGDVSMWALNECTPGYELTIATANCQYCTSGKYKYPKGVGRCLLCPSGQWQAVAFSSSCNAVPSGSQVWGAAKNMIIVCQPGTASPGGLDTCPTCSAGTYQPDFGQTSCLPIPAGKQLHPFMTWPTMAILIDCEPGYYSPGSINVCLPCTVAGTYSPSFGAANCSTIPPGSYLDSSNNGIRSAILQCPVGSYSLGGADTCANCTFGRYQPLVGAATCDAIPRGSYLKKFANETRSAVVQCPAGSYSLGGNDTCTDCPVGSYQPLIGQGGCTAAPPGTYVSTTRASVATSCPFGKVSFTSGQTGCTPCPAGSIPDATASTCAPCPQGMFSAITGGTLCSPCARGFYADTIGSSYCQLCPPNSYTNHESSASCSTCPAGALCSVGSATPSIVAIAGITSTKLELTDTNDQTKADRNSAMIGISAIMLTALVTFGIVCLQGNKSEKLQTKLVEFDFFYNLDHAFAINQSPTKKKTTMGGFMSICAFTGILLILFYVGFQSRLTQSSENFSLLFRVPKAPFTVTFTVDWLGFRGLCDSQDRFTGITFPNGDLNIPSGASTLSSSLVDSTTCRLHFSCTGCTLNSNSITALFSQTRLFKANSTSSVANSNVMANAATFGISISSPLPNQPSTMSGTILPTVPGNALQTVTIAGGITFGQFNRSTILAAETPETLQQGFAIQQSVARSISTSELDGTQVLIPGDTSPAIAAGLDPIASTALTAEITLTLNTYSQAFLLKPASGLGDLFTQIASLAGASIGFFRVLLGLFEDMIIPWYTRKFPDRIPQKPSEFQDFYSRKQELDDTIINSDKSRKSFFSGSLETEFGFVSATKGFVPSSKAFIASMPPLPSPTSLSPAWMKPAVLLRSLQPIASVSVPPASTEFFGG